MPRPRIVALRGHNANVWDLRVYEALADDYDVAALVTGSNLHETASLRIPIRRIRTPRDLLPRGRAAGALAYAAGERYVGLREHLAGADIVHAAEIGTWFSAQAADLRDELGFKLVLTVWETLPWGEAYRWPRERRYRRRILPRADLFLAASERARRGLLLEGVDAGIVEVAWPGIDTAHFAAGRASEPEPAVHTVLSAGRLVWEKGHQDVIRAIAALRRGLAGPPRTDVRLLVVGDGPERERLRRHADELGVGDAVELRPRVPYAEMPALYASASALVLASLPTKVWEEQFGMVLAEAMAAGTPIVAARSGAIPEVLDGHGSLVEPGDWLQIAVALAEGPLARPPAARQAAPRALVERYDLGAAATRLRRAYERVLGR